MNKGVFRYILRKWAAARGLQIAAARPAGGPEMGDQIGASLFRRSGNAAEAELPAGRLIVCALAVHDLPRRRSFHVFPCPDCDSIPPDGIGLGTVCVVWLPVSAILKNPFFEN